MSAKFMICRRCGNQVEILKESGVPMMCCGQKMDVLEPNTVEASTEKHLPVVTRTEGALVVEVGSAAHPMVPEHYIEWVYMETTTGGVRKDLKPGQDPKVTFCLCGEEPVAVYAYCNLHGLWMTKL
ncbi:MAG: desulfoferrodoxin [Ruminococcaceae bacterium]|nr:desulfoferrodoxin [Oscillospiraceae bacterium]